MAQRARIDLRVGGEIFPVEALIENGVCREIRTLKEDCPQRCLPLEQALNEAIKNRAAKVDFPCDTAAMTPLQKRIFAFMDSAVPPGKTITYGVLAKVLGTSPRGVASALAHNPLPLFFPCHRVVGQHGLSGYSLHGLKLKVALLESEKLI